jgi:hypothetical protein
MGGVASANVNVSTQSTVSNAITNAIITNTSNCTAQNTNAISLQFGTVVGDFNLTNANLSQSVTINSSCLQQTTNNTAILNSIQANLTQAYENGTSGALFSASVNSQVSTAITNVANSVNIANIKSCLLNNLTSTAIGANYVGGNVNITNLTVGQVTNLVQSCVQNDTNITAATNQLATALSSAQTNQSSTIVYIVIGILCFLILIYLVSSLFGGNSNEKNKNLQKSNPDWIYRKT